MMGLESATSGVLSSDAQNVAITESREKHNTLGTSPGGGQEEDIKRAGSLDSSREVDANEKSEECAKSEAEADQPDVIRNGSLDNARTG